MAAVVKRLTRGRTHPLCHFQMLSPCGQSCFEADKGIGVLVKIERAADDCADKLIALANEVVEFCHWGSRLFDWRRGAIVKK